jgi:hypothetical protein
MISMISGGLYALFHQPAELQSLICLTRQVNRQFPWVSPVALEAGVGFSPAQYPHENLT